MIDGEYGTLTEIGKIVGLGPHKFGRALANMGLRKVGGSPTSIAFDSGLVKTAPTGRGDPSGYFYVWRVERTLALVRDKLPQSA